MSLFFVLSGVKFASFVQIINNERFPSLCQFQRVFGWLGESFPACAVEAAISIELLMAKFLLFSGKTINLWNIMDLYTFMRMACHPINILDFPTQNMSEQSSEIGRNSRKESEEKGQKMKSSRRNLQSISEGCENYGWRGHTRREKKFPHLIE